MKKKTISEDLDRILSDIPMDEEFEMFSKALKKYIKSRNLDVHDVKDQVDLLLVIFSILEIPEEELLEFISRLNVMKLTLMGVIEMWTKNYPTQYKRRGDEHGNWKRFSMENT